MLVVESDAVLARALSRFLRGRGATVVTAATGAEAETLMRSTELDVVICSDRLPDVGGAELLFNVQGRSSHALRVLCTASEELVHMLEAGPVSVLMMPAAPQALWELVATRSSTHRHEARRPPRPAGHFWVKNAR
ncbi:MAG: response regulator [Archangiaceae bacterium]|nr:response regulator [Archangiaceae bacterium]